MTRDPLVEQGELLRSAISNAFHPIIHGTVQVNHSIPLNLNNMLFGILKTGETKLIFCTSHKFWPKLAA